MSKSGLFAHFGSKEELQLATIETAAVIFTEDVIDPAATSGATGLERLRQLTENFLRHVESGVFPGGCFFASVAGELDALPGPVRRRAVDMVTEWYGLLIAAAVEGRRTGRSTRARIPSSWRSRSTRSCCSRTRSTRSRRRRFRSSAPGARSPGGSLRPRPQQASATRVPARSSLIDETWKNHRRVGGR